MDKRKRGNIFSSTAAMIQGNLDAFWRTPRTLLMMVFYRVLLLLDGSRLCDGFSA